ncbi:MAG: hypothetical protein MUF52_10050 [Syntrophobacteraceae bacterium]|jgi:hypothetical protein|nr:hypothetical protein [Syntrophobacteraceae bacterium]
MKQGLIVYVTEGKDEVALQDAQDLKGACRSLGASAVRVATTEDDLAYGWWQLIGRGMHQVSCVSAAYDAAEGTFKPHGAVMRLWG